MNNFEIGDKVRVKRGGDIEHHLAGYYGTVNNVNGNICLVSHSDTFEGHWVGCDCLELDE